MVYVYCGSYIFFKPQEKPGIIKDKVKLRKLIKTKVNKTQKDMLFDFKMSKVHYTILYICQYCLIVRL